MKADIHGSCVSFSVIKREVEGKIFRLPNVKNNYYFSHINIAGTMTGKISQEPLEEDFSQVSNHIRRNTISDLKKEVPDILMNSDADWLIIDFYDFARVQWAYENGSYTHVANLSYVAPEYYKKIEQEIITEGYFRWIDLPTFLWYDKVDCYFEQMIKKYGKKHIVLNRVNLSRYCLDEKKEIQEFPKEMDYIGSYKDREKIRRLEDHVIQKYGIHSIDVAKYFMADWEAEHDYLSVHYEPQYYKLAGKILEGIVLGKKVMTDQLDIESIIYKLRRNQMLYDKSLNIQYFACAESPFAYYEPLDNLLKVLNPYEVLESTEIIIELYQLVEEKADFFYDESVDIVEKQKILVKEFENRVT